MGSVADAGRAWEDATKAAEAAENGGSPKEKLVAKTKLQEAFDALQRALDDNAAATDDDDDAAYRRQIFGQDEQDEIVNVQTESTGSSGIKSSSGSEKGSI